MGEKEIQVKINFRIPARMPSVIGQEMTASRVPDGVLLSFFEVIQPVFTQEPTPEQLKALEQTGIIAECVSKVFIPESKYQSLVEALMSLVPNDGSKPDIPANAGQLSVKKRKQTVLRTAKNATIDNSKLDFHSGGSKK